MHVHLPVPKLFRGVFQSHASAGAGVVDQNVQSAIGVLCQLYGGFPVGFAGDIKPCEHGVVPVLAQLRFGAAPLLFVNVG